MSEPAANQGRKRVLKRKTDLGLIEFDLFSAAQLLSILCLVSLESYWMTDESHPCHGFYTVVYHMWGVYMYLSACTFAVHRFNILHVCRRFLLNEVQDFNGVRHPKENDLKIRHKVRDA